MTDTTIENIPQEMDDLEMAQTVEEFKRMRQMNPGEELPEDLIKMYKKYEKQRSILGLNGNIHPLEKLQLSAMYDMVSKNFSLPKPKTVDDHIFNQQEEVVEEEDERQLVEPEKGYTYVKDEKVGAQFKGTMMLGKFIEYIGDKNEMAKVKIQGDKLEFRKFDIADIKPYKEVK